MQDPQIVASGDATGIPHILHAGPEYLSIPPQHDMHMGL